MIYLCSRHNQSSYYVYWHCQKNFFTGIPMCWQGSHSPFVAPVSDNSAAPADETKIMSKIIMWPPLQKSKAYKTIYRKKEIRVGECSVWCWSSNIYRLLKQPTFYLHLLLNQHFLVLQLLTRPFPYSARIFTFEPYLGGCWWLSPHNHQCAIKPGGILTKKKK